MFFVLCELLGRCLLFWGERGGGGQWIKGLANTSRRLHRNLNPSSNQPATLLILLVCILEYPVLLPYR